MKKQLLLWTLLCTCLTLTRGWARSGSFIQNVGQITDTALKNRTDIDFKVSGQQGLQVFIGRGSIHYQWISPLPETDGTIQYQGYRLDMQLQGCNPHATIAYGQRKAAYERYYLSWVNNDNRQEGRTAHRYESITYRNIYPNIDWTLYFTPDGHMEYDFIVHPGGRVSDIRMVYSGADGMNIQPDGQLHITTPQGRITERAPYSYEQRSRKPVASRYHLDGHTVRIIPGAYKGTLVIDPVIEWGTYFGDISADGATAVTTDKRGYLYMAGTTNSTANIATQGAHQQTFGGGSAFQYGNDGIVSRWTPDGQLLWATYYGGTGIDILKNIKADTAGNIYVAGYTQSTAGIATAGSFQQQKAGTNSGYDALLLKMDSAGTRQWGTYFGGNLDDGNTAVSLALDHTGMTYLAGSTQSIDLYTTPGAHSNTRQLTDGFVAKFDPQGQPVWSTYYGGPATDIITAVAVDANRNVYITGYTQSAAGIATPGAHQVTRGGGDDGFLTRMDSLGIPVWGTYIGGSAIDRCWSLAVKDTLVVIGGLTRSTTNISTPNAFQPAMNSVLDDGMLAAFHTNGSRLWSTYFGGESIDQIYSTAIVDDTLIYFGMETKSLTNIAVPGILKDSMEGLSALALGKFSIHGQRIWSTYVGGNDIDVAVNITAAANNRLYISGTTLSGSGIASGNVHQTALSGNYDAFIMKISDCEAPAGTAALRGPDSVCAQSSAAYTLTPLPGAVRYHWQLPAGWMGSSDSSTIHIVTGAQNGPVKVWAESSCGGTSDTTFLDIYVFPEPDVSITRQNNMLRSTATFPFYQWLRNGHPVPGATQSTYIPTENGDYTLQVMDHNGCTGLSDAIEITHLGIGNALSEAGISVYPNPVGDHIRISVPEPVQLEVYNSTGMQCLYRALEAGTRLIALHELPAGMYMFRFVTAAGVYTCPVVKQ